jgi:hypothetical protein
MTKTYRGAIITKRFEQFRTKENQSQSTTLETKKITHTQILTHIIQNKNRIIILESKTVHFENDKRNSGLI